MKKTVYVIIIIYAMTIVFYTNFINHHQMPLADELYNLTDGNYYFVETEPIYEWLKAGGYSDFSSKPYVVQAWKSSADAARADELLKIADVVLFNPTEGLKYGVAAAKMGKLCFEISERWLKRGVVNVLSPRLLKNMWCYHTLFKYKSVYKLCSSAFAASDQYKLQSYKNRCFKWGYFTKVDENSVFVTLNSDVTNTENTPIMWCARFLKLKHPELPIKMASRLKTKGYKFTLNMYGSGDELENSIALVKELNVGDVVKFYGNLPNEQILETMRRHEIFLFTSDKNEGWGAVVNESMINGCVPVGSNKIGSIPYLLKDGENGCIFKSEDLNSLTEKVEWLLNNPNERMRMRVNACNTMRNLWSPANAAKSFIQLIDDLQNGRDVSIKEGPCSKALPL